VRAEIIEAQPRRREQVFAPVIVIEVRELPPARALADTVGPAMVPDAGAQMRRAVASYALAAELPCPRGLLVRVRA